MKLFGYIMTALLAATLLGGSAYVLLRPEPTAAQDVTVQGERGHYAPGHEVDTTVQGDGGSYAPGRDSSSGHGRWANPSGCDGEDCAEEARRGYGSDSHIECEPVNGVVIAVNEVVVRSGEEEILIGMGQSSYWADFAISVGDELEVTGYYEDGEFKACTVTNVTTGESIVLRDESGHPMWAEGGHW